MVPRRASSAPRVSARPPRVDRAVRRVFFFPPQGKESVYALTLENNNGTFEVTPAVIDRRGRFTVMVRNNRLLDFESRTSVRFEVGHGDFYLPRWPARVPSRGFSRATVAHRSSRDRRRSPPRNALWPK